MPDEGADRGPGEVITSPDNRRVRAARRLRDSASARRRSERFLVEGPQAVREALATEGIAVEVFVDVAVADLGPVTGDASVRAAEDERHTVPSTIGDGRSAVASLLDRAAVAGVPVTRLATEVIATLSDTVTSQGVLAVCHTVARPWPGYDGFGDATLLVGLDRVQDPGNAGTVIRTADAVAADAVLLSGESVDPHNGKCVRSTAGSIFHLALATGVDLVAAADKARSAGMRVLAAHGDGALPLGSPEAEDALRRPTFWLFGNEAAGLSPEVLAAADASVAVPIPGRAESLNVATAVAVCLYESLRVRRAHMGTGPRTP